MTELTLHANGESAPPATRDLLPTDPTGGRLIAWANAAHAANQLAKALCTTSFVPRVKNPRSGQMEPISEGDATAQILMGDELGLSPLAALRSLFVVHGTPSMYTRTMVALVQSHGHEVWTAATSDASVTVCGRRRGSDKIESATWTTTRAQKAKYTNNPKYSTNPQEMLYAKAAGEVCRKIAADVIAGIPATIEDLELSEPEATVTVTRADAPASRMQRKKTEPAQPLEPTLEPDVPAPTAAAPDLRSESQMRKLWALAKERGMDEGAFRTYLSEKLGRKVETTKTLTSAEAHRLIEALETFDAELVDPATGEIMPDQYDGPMFTEGDK